MSRSTSRPLSSSPSPAALVVAPPPSPPPSLLIAILLPQGPFLTQLKSGALVRLTKMGGGGFSHVITPLATQFPGPNFSHFGLSFMSNFKRTNIETSGM